MNDLAPSEKPSPVAPVDAETKLFLEKRRLTSEVDVERRRDLRRVPRVDLLFPLVKGSVGRDIRP